MVAFRLPGLRIARWAMNASFGLLGPATFHTEVQLAAFAALIVAPVEKHSATLGTLAALSPSSRTPVVMLVGLLVEALKVAKVPPPRTKVPTTARTMRPTRTCLARLIAPVRSPAAFWTGRPTGREVPPALCQRVCRVASRDGAGAPLEVARSRTVLLLSQAVQRKLTSAARSTLFSWPHRLQGTRMVGSVLIMC